jgi:hypothetical protein
VVRRVAAVLAAVGLWLAWTSAAPHLSRPDDAGVVATGAAIALPLACLAIVVYALLLRDRMWLQVAAAGAGLALAAWGIHTSHTGAAGAGKLVAAASIGLLAAAAFERSWQVALVAVLVIGVDAWSVYAGPTHALLQGDQQRLSWFTVPIAGAGVTSAGGIGSVDLLFLALFVAASLRFELRPAVTIPLCVLSLPLTYAIANAIGADLPALPLLSAAFVLPNIRRLLPNAPPLIDAARQPATAANVRRNASGRADRSIRWLAARDALWAVLDPVVRQGAAVAVVGAGNCDDLPLTRLAERAGHVDLMDLDITATTAAIAREPAELQVRLRAVAADVTGGLADRIVRAVAAGRMAPVPVQDWQPIGDAPYDVVIGDLFYTQLLYPGLLDAGVPEERIAIALKTYSAALTGLAVSRLQATARGGVVVHIDDPIAWWDGHEQPFTAEEALAAAARGADDALRLIETGNRPIGSDPRLALAALGIPVRRTAFWVWQFAPRVDYLVCASVAKGLESPS